MANDLTAQSMPGTFLSSQMESARMPSETPAEAITESSLLWFLRWFNENVTPGDPSTENSTSSQVPDPPSVVPCRICMDEVLEDEAIFIPNCRHTFCKDCLSTYVIGKLKERRYPIHCPCCTTEDRMDIRKWCLLKLTHTLIKMSLKMLQKAFSRS